MEDFFQRLHGAIGQCFVGLNEEIAHLALPSFIDVAFRHTGARFFKVVRLKIADEQAAVAEEQRIVAPSRFTQGSSHFGPHFAMTLLVFVEPFGRRATSQ